MTPLYIAFIFLASIALLTLVPAMFVDQSIRKREHADEERERLEYLGVQRCVRMPALILGRIESASDLQCVEENIGELRGNICEIMVLGFPGGWRAE